MEMNERLRQILLPLFPSDPHVDERGFRISLREKTTLDEGDLTEDVQLKRNEPIEIEKAVVDEAEKSIVYVITSSVIDRHREIVDPSGLDLKNFRASQRTVFFNHDQNLPIGKSLWEKHEKSKERWIAKVKFADGVTPFATDIWNLAKEGFLGMTSIGFLPKSYAFLPASEVEETLGLHPVNLKDFGGDEQILVWPKAELYEYSVVGVGANPEAVQLQKILSKDLQSDYLRGILGKAYDEARLCELESCKEKMEKAVDERLRALEATIDILRSEKEELQKTIDKVSKREPEMDSQTRTLKPEEIESLTERGAARAIRFLKGRIDD